MSTQLKNVERTMEQEIIRCCFSVAYLHPHTGGEFSVDHDSRTMYINLIQPATKETGK